jgi:hypothetical protein
LDPWKLETKSEKERTTAAGSLKRRPRCNPYESLLALDVELEYHVPEWSEQRRWTDPVYQS